MHRSQLAMVVSRKMLRPCGATHQVRRHSIHNWAVMSKWYATSCGVSSALRRPLSAMHTPTEDTLVHIKNAAIYYDREY